MSRNALGHPQTCSGGASTYELDVCGVGMDRSSQCSWSIQDLIAIKPLDSTALGRLLTRSIVRIDLVEGGVA